LPLRALQVKHQLEENSCELFLHLLKYPQLPGSLSTPTTLFTTSLSSSRRSVAHSSPGAPACGAEVYRNKLITNVGKEVLNIMRLDRPQNVE
jgi:hypothetical protein